MPIEDFNFNQQNVLLKWCRKRTRKRAARFLQSVAGVDGKLTANMINKIWGIEFELPESDVSVELPAFDLQASAALPIRHLWNVCGKLQDLRARFDAELLRRKLLAMKQLAYGASHEINNPLANIATRAQSLLAEECHSSKRQRLSVIYAQAMRAHEMISDMMLFAQPPDVSFESVDIKSLIEGVVGELQSELQRRQIVISLRQYPAAQQCELDSTQIAVAVKALIQNAIEAIGCAGEIRVQIWKRNENCVGISIADNGCGIPAEISDQIFDPFFSGREAGRGLGFGLSKVWRIVELHDGELAVENGDSGKWTTRFVISLPQSRQQEDTNNNSRIDNWRAA